MRSKPKSALGAATYDKTNMSFVMNVAASAKAAAPQMTAEALAQPGKLDAAYKQWRQHELAKDSEA